MLVVIGSNGYFGNKQFKALEELDISGNAVGRKLEHLHMQNCES